MKKIIALLIVFWTVSLEGYGQVRVEIEEDDNSQFEHDPVEIEEDDNFLYENDAVIIEDENFGPCPFLDCNASTVGMKFYASVNFLSPKVSSSKYYSIYAIIKSTSKITNVTVIVNSSRRINCVLNDNYRYILSETLTLNNGDNYVIVSVTNDAGTTTHGWRVKVL